MSCAFQQGHPVWHPYHGWGTFLRHDGDDGQAVVTYGRDHQGTDIHHTVTIEHLRTPADPDIPTDQNLEQLGYAEGYRVGPEGIDQVGNPAAYRRPDLLGHDLYRAGASAGRAARIDDQLAAGTHHLQRAGRGQVWVGDAT